MRYIDPDGRGPEEAMLRAQLWHMRNMTGISEEEQDEALWESGDTDASANTDKNEDDSSKKKKKADSEGNNLYLDEIGIFLGSVELGVNSWDKYISTPSLYRQGFRRGINGNYLLTGRNLSLFSQEIMTSNTAPITTLGRFGKGLGFGGTTFGALSAIDNGIALHKGKISISRFGYRITGGGVSLGLSLMKGGGPLGFLVGAEVYSFEKGYDKIAPQVQSSFDQFYRALINGWLNQQR